MARSSDRPPLHRPDRRLAAALVMLLTLGGVVAAVRVSASTAPVAGASVNDVQLAHSRQKAATSREPAKAAARACAASTRSGPAAKRGSYTDRLGATHHHAEGLPARTRSGKACAGQNGGQGAGQNGGQGAGQNGGQGAGQNGGQGGGQPPAQELEILGNTCEGSRLQPHDGFQAGNRCVSTQFGEVGDFDKNPTLLITESPDQIKVGQSFELKVSTRNLVRDRFLAAAQGGYYKESSFLNKEGLVRGHFHTACRMLPSLDEAPESAPPPAFFVATEDGSGGAEPDTVTIRVPGMPTAGTAQCASWAGDGSHRIPMMASVQAVPAVDLVRFTVTT